MLENDVLVNAPHIQGSTTKPSKAKIDPTSVDRDIEHFSARFQRKPQNGLGFSVGDRYSPTNWPRDDTISLASGANAIKRYRGYDVPGPKYSREFVGNGKAYSFSKSDRLPERKCPLLDPSWFDLLTLLVTHRAYRRTGHDVRLEQSQQECTTQPWLPAAGYVRKGSLRQHLLGAI